MASISQWMTRPVAIAALITGVFFGCFFLFMASTFETNDDVIMSLVASGKLIAETPDPHLVFSNILVGKLLATLYGSMPGVPWYGLYLVSLHGLAILAICHAVLRMEVTRVRVGLLLVYLSIVELYQLKYLQFTNTASMCIQAGLLLLISTVLHPPDSRRRRLALMACALALTAAAALVRADVLLLAAPLAVPALLFAWIKAPGCRVPLALWTSAAVAISASLTAVDRRAYERDPEWAGFREFNTLRNRITDLGPDLGYPWSVVCERRAQNIAAAGWTPTDFRLLTAWGFLDARKFNVDAFRRYLADIPQVRETRKVWRQLNMRLLQLRMIPVGLLIACIVAHIPWNRRTALVVVPTLTLTFIVLVGLASSLKLERRVVLPTVSFAVLIALLFVRSADFGAVRLPWIRIRPRWSIGFVTACLAGLWVLEFCLSRQQLDRNREFRADIVASGANPQTLLVSCGGSLQIESILPLENLEYLAPVRCLFLGWTNRTPVANRMLQRFGIHDLFASLPDRDDVLVIAPPQTSKDLPQGFQKEIVYSILPNHLRESQSIQTAYDVRYEGTRLRLLKLRRAESGDDTSDLSKKSDIDQTKQSAEATMTILPMLNDDVGKLPPSADGLPSAGADESGLESGQREKPWTQGAEPMPGEIPFNKPYIVGTEMHYIAKALTSGRIAADGEFTNKCARLLEERFGILKVLMTPSCTASLEIAAQLCGVGPGDEVIMPSYTFVSTANAFVRLGARPVFVDIRPDTMNLDEKKIEAAITPSTKAICPVHYGGVSCNMDKILDIACRHDLRIVEDAAQGVDSWYDDRACGSIGEFGAFSFHDTKNFVCGEGGALCINAPDAVLRAEIIRDKGTNRKQFFRGEVDKYTWVDVGSSYVPSEINCAFLYAQLEQIDRISARRREIAECYDELLHPLARDGQLKLPAVPENCVSNHHLYFIYLPSSGARDGLLAHLKRSRIHAVFHYVPLHLSPMGKAFGYSLGDLPVTENLSARLLRLPMYYDINETQQRDVIRHVADFLDSSRRSVAA